MVTLDEVVERWWQAVAQLSHAVRGGGALFVMVQPAFLNQGAEREPFQAADLQRLLPFVDYLMLMTYHAYGGAQPQAPAATAPLAWMAASLNHVLPPEQREDAAARGKLLLGLPFYGHEFPAHAPPRAVLAHDVLARLAEHRADAAFHWDVAARERRLHFAAADGSRTTVYYPTLKFLADRLELCQELGVGVGIWELGQGMDYFFDLL